MAAKDFYYKHVKNALDNDDWDITHEELRLRWRTTNTYIDLGAEKLLGAERDKQKIAVEIKSFRGKSVVNDLEDAIGQYFLYEELLKRLEPDRILYLAIPYKAYQSAFVEAIGEILLESKQLRLIVFDPNMEIIVKWIH